MGVAIGLGIAFAGFIVACAICYIGNILNQWLEQFDQSMMCYLALMRTQLRIELDEAGYELPEWLEDGPDEEEEEAKPRGPGKLIQLVKKPQEEEDKRDD